MNLSIIIPTAGTRESLSETIESCVSQMRPDDELIVDYNAISYGNGARQRSMEKARGDVLLFQDDDDIYAPGAFEMVRRELEADPTRMHIFRMHYIENEEDLWMDREVRSGNVASQMIAVPNIPEKLGEWGDRYEGDFDFISSTCDPEVGLGEPVFHEEVLSLVHHPQLRTIASRTGVVVTCAPGREDNVRRTLACIAALNPAPVLTMVIFDGCPVPGWLEETEALVGLSKPKHVAYKDIAQPRTVGFQELRKRAFITHCWFLDSDIIFAPDLLGIYSDLCTKDEDKILVGPYDWLPEGVTEIDGNVVNDPRWPIFLNRSRWLTSTSAALGCFGGNIIYPAKMFEALGGFDPQLHHGRCEDGELGLRAVAAGSAVRFVAEARAWHVAHEIDLPTILERNKQDVATLYSWHVSLRNEGFRLVPEDGARLDWVCPNCSQQMNAHLVWGHECQR